MASLSLCLQFETNLMSNRKVIELVLQLKNAKAHGKIYVKVKPHLVRHLLRNRLLTSKPCNICEKRLLLKSYSLCPPATVAMYCIGKYPNFWGLCLKYLWSKSHNFGKVVLINIWIGPVLYLRILQFASFKTKEYLKVRQMALILLKIERRCAWQIRNRWPRSSTPDLEFFKRGNKKSITKWRMWKSRIRTRDPMISSPTL